jgi:hypothetical protein
MARQQRSKGKTTRKGPRLRGKGPSGSKSEYFSQPGKRGAVIVLRKPCGNRAAPKVCGTMPTRVHAKMLITLLEKAESAVNDLFLEATDDGIEALEAVLAACREEVLRKGPRGGERDVSGPAEAEPRRRGTPNEGRPAGAPAGAPPEEYAGGDAGRNEANEGGPAPKDDPL